MTEIRVLPIAGIPEIAPGDDVAEAIANAAGPGAVVDDDVIVVAQKIVSKAEGRLASGADKDAVVLEESRRILRRTVGGTIIAETRHGHVCANAGVDASNVEPGTFALLPLDPDLSARRIRSRLERLTGARLAVVISDTFGRAWRLGQTNVAIGIAGLRPFNDYRGRADAFGQELTATIICVADELAGAAELVMGKADRIPAAIVRGAGVEPGRGAATEIVRSPAEDLFR
ncbi:MAG: coenzyme F420-0:L-glutamate ligase [Actinomycetota bacterium]